MKLSDFLVSLCQATLGLLRTERDEWAQIVKDTSKIETLGGEIPTLALLHDKALSPKSLTMSTNVQFDPAKLTVETKRPFFGDNSIALSLEIEFETAPIPEAVAQTIDNNIRDLKGLSNG